ncbi:hypothetical protein [Halorussus salinisoli]|uniref:hypothetical protein n=1 Tax=Halorussus salinisoli TaxID=2558242 RepID=UPI0014851811|nr:hypothetical protein [Halorussus salinisoli]
MAASAGMTAGWTDPTYSHDDVNTDSETIFVFNTGDMTVSVIDAASDEVVATPYLDLTSSFPSNQFTPQLTDTPSDPLWLNVDRGVRAVEVGSLSEVAAVETGSGANWQEVTPDGKHLVVSAREPAHTQYRIDADPDSDSFGEVTVKIDRTDEEGRGDNDGPGPCDVTIHPDGAYAYVPDIFADTLTVIDIDAFELANQISVAPDDGAGAVQPFMGTAGWNGDVLLVENFEGESGTESIWDTSDPAAPTERVRLTTDDGLGNGAFTSEIGPDSKWAYVFTPDSNDVTVIDLDEGAVTDRIDLGGSAFVGTWGPSRERLYVPVQTNDEVKVIDHASGEVTATIPVGAMPYGATAATVRPREDTLSSLLGVLATLGVEFSGAGTSYCIGKCGCGHRL